MELDHVFLELDYDDATQRVAGLAAVRTDRKGAVLASYSDRGELNKLYSCFVTSLLDGYSHKFVMVAQYTERHKKVMHPYMGARSWLDIAQLAWPLGFSDMIPDRELESLARHFGIASVGAEDGVKLRCETVVRVYFAMMKRYRTVLLAEEAARDIGGETLATIRAFLKF